MKTCIKCNEEKPFSDYHRKASSKDGYYPTCRLCRGTKKPRQPRRLPTIDLAMWCATFAHLLAERYGLPINVSPGESLDSTKQAAIQAVQDFQPTGIREKLKQSRLLQDEAFYRDVDAFSVLGMRMADFQRREWIPAERLPVVDPYEREVLADLLSVTANEELRAANPVHSHQTVKNRSYREISMERIPYLAHTLLGIDGADSYD
jgi:hypothetical protein